MNTNIYILLLPHIYLYTKNNFVIQNRCDKMKNQENKNHHKKFVFGNERFGGSYTPGEFEFNFPEDMSREDFERMFTSKMRALHKRSNDFADEFFENASKSRKENLKPLSIRVKPHTKEFFKKYSLLSPRDVLEIYENFKLSHRGESEDSIQKAWNEYVPKHLLPRINGFELMMAPYAVAHMKLAMVLKETGYNFDSEKRLQVYLTNTLEESNNSGAQMSLFSDPLAMESVEANQTKNNPGINIIIGNPPYSYTSSNKGSWIRDLVSIYKDGLNEKKIHLDDDYIKFIRRISDANFIAFIVHKSTSLYYYHKNNI